uniref:Nuclear factor related to kappa-B-binding protein n=1 Tax=Anthurium amnicola TaxID=1678845 RepID=A0A1D1XSV3_9ARAE
MAAGQRKKRLNGASVIRVNLHEYSIGKKKMKLESSDVLLNMAPHVSLEWDHSKNKVVAKREQVGIAWRDISPFLDPVPQFRMALADVFSLPRETFGLENLADVLSYEVWESYLSERERKLLIQFLPRGVDVDNVVQSLLAGENFHFGNPFIKWGVSLLAHNLHPDAVIHREQQLRATRDAYFWELEKYHSEIIENLSELKERWTSCKNPEKEIAEKIQREGITKLKNGSQSVAPEKAKVLFSSEKEQKQNTSFHTGDTAKYMSYIKISKKQHQLVKSIKHSSDGIQSKCLSHVLGDINGFDVQPYEAFEEEERKRLHEHWLQLVNNDLPAAFEDRSKFRLLRDKWRKSVQHELTEKEVLIKDEEKESLRFSPLEHVDGGDSEKESPLNTPDEGHVRHVHFTDCHHLERNFSVDHHQELSATSSDRGHNLDVLEVTSACFINHSSDNCHLEAFPSLNSPREHNPYVVDHGGNGNIVDPATSSPALSNFNGREHDAENTVQSKVSSTSVHQLERIPSLNSHNELSTVNVHEDENQALLKCADNYSVVSEFLRRMPTNNNAVEENHSTSSHKEPWQGGNTGHLCHHYPSENQVYASSSGLSLQQPQPVEERSASLIDLEAQIPDQQALHVNNRAGMFNSNANQGHNLLLPLHEQGLLLSHSQGHLNASKQSGLQFLAVNDGLPQSGHFPHLFEEQQLLKRCDATQKGLCMQPTLKRNAHSGSRNPSRGHLMSAGSQDWANFQSPVNGLMVPSWFGGEHDTRNGWSAAEISGTAGQCLGDTGNADGSLFSVLSECNKLPSHSPFVTMSSGELLPGENFVNRSDPHSDRSHTYVPPLNAGSREATALKMSSMPWMNFSLQNRGLSDSLEKSFPRYWNQ